jgi:regulator of protease activity HflC (stomatin/prohibitin superfamily)
MDMQQEKDVKVSPGGSMLALTIILFAAVLGLIPLMVKMENHPMLGWVVAADIVICLVAVLLSIGFFIVEPNGSKVLLLFGSYKGTVKQSGFHWANPFLLKRKVSLRARTLNGERLKVNDNAGNPVEIAAIVVWEVKDTFRASFEVDNYEQYVALQSETAVRHLASSFPYDGDDDQTSLRRNTDEVSEHLKEELGQRLDRAGVCVLEARLSHLAYAQEIAGVMLRRQQATAVIAARRQIVDGAVGMVEMALERLEEHKTIKLDEERKAAMVTNLMVVLCSEQAAQPVLNTGTLYP